MGKLKRPSPEPPVFSEVDRAGIAARLGHAFRDEDLLMEALTPPSAGLPVTNQRMEFLGDALLQACVSMLLYREKPGWDEGALSKLRGTLVSHVALREMALSLGVELVRGPRSNLKGAAVGAGKPLSDAMEALLAAVYMDEERQGRSGFSEVMALVERLFLGAVREAQRDTWKSNDSKTVLQEFAQERRLSLPVYETLGQEGPPHAPTFLVRVQVGEARAEASAKSLKGAQMEAARVLLARLEKAP